MAAWPCDNEPDKVSRWQAQEPQIRQGQSPRTGPSLLHLKQYHIGGPLINTPFALWPWDYTVRNSCVSKYADFERSDNAETLCLVNGDVVTCKLPKATFPPGRAASILFPILFSLVSMTRHTNVWETQKEVVFSRCRLLIDMTNGVKLWYYRGNTNA